MIVIEKPLYQQIFLYNKPEIQEFEQVNRIGVTGKAYLRSIIETKHKHIYKGWWYLIFSLNMRDKLPLVAKMVNQKVGFANVPANMAPMLDPSYWRQLPGGDFECTTDDYAKAVDAILSNSANNRLECRGLCELMALRALQDAVGNVRFNRFLKAHLGSEKLKIRLNTKLLQGETLTAKPPYINYTGEGVFRPGDLVAFGNDRQVAQGTQWRVENAICIGWKLDQRNEPRYNEPVFVGGGVNDPKTEAQMKEYIFQQTPDHEVKGPVKAHFAEKSISGPKCKHLLDSVSIEKGWSLKNSVPDIYLHSTVDRIRILGGRSDL